MDILSKEERSKRMSLIRSKWTKQELKVHNYLKGRKIKHKMHPRIPGSPDILIDNKKAVFLHGCFWHKCLKCYRAPKTRKQYWAAKMQSNTLRDNSNKLLLKRNGYDVIVIWEHDLRKDFGFSLERLIK